MRCCALFLLLLGNAWAVEPALVARWNDTVAPIMENHCLGCHDSGEAKGDVDLEAVFDPQLLADAGTLAHHMELVISHHEMPPRSRKSQPTAAERETLVTWLKDLQLAVAKKHAGDPGVVVMPRMTPEQFAAVARDLTGVSTSAHNQLPAEGGVGEGFTNVGEAHTMTTSQADAWMAAARSLLSQGRFIPGTPIRWSSVPRRDADTDEALRAQLFEEFRDWFRNQVDVQLTDLEKRLNADDNQNATSAYLERSRLLHAKAGTATELAQQGTQVYVSPIERVREFMTQAPLNPVHARLQERWKILPTEPKALRGASKELANWFRGRTETASFVHWRTALETINDAKVKRISIDKGNWPFELNLVPAQGSMVIAASSADDESTGEEIRISGGTITLADGSTAPWQQQVTLQGATWQGDGFTMKAPGIVTLLIPSGAKALTATGQVISGGDEGSVQLLADLKAPEDLSFFPRTRVFGQGGANKASERIRKEQSEIGSRLADQIRDRSWNAEGILLMIPEFLAGAALNPADFSKRSSTFAVYAAQNPTPPEIYAAATAEDQAALQALVAQMRASTAPPSNIDALARQELEAFATTAWRRSAKSQEIDALFALYKQERDQGRTYEASMKHALLGALLSPHFLYRSTQSQSQTPGKATPLQGLELATRLSFTLWGSLPDDILRNAAERGDLNNKVGLREQVMRMIRDPRAEFLAKRFAGEWLGFAGFDQFSGPDPERFKAFTPVLREAMYQEAMLFFLDLFQNKRPASDVILSRYSFLNETLAKHYGIQGVKGPEFVRTPLPPNRQGVLGMGAFLTKYSNPLRTSPVKRGVWVWEHVLSQELAPPPPVVPRISDDERDKAGRTIREQLAEHRNNEACLVCHQKFDPLGIALEQFDPIGAFRERDLAGDLVDATDTNADGTVLAGASGLFSWFSEKKQVETFTKGFARKLLAYSLGRGILLSDQPLIDELAQLDQGAPSAESVLLGVVLSQQFRYRRDLTE